MIAASTWFVPTARAIASSVCIGLSVMRLDVEMLDAGDLLELIVRGRAERADRDRLVGDVLEFVQAPC